jgi:hypothetical protein
MFFRRRNPIQQQIQILEEQNDFIGSLLYSYATQDLKEIS